MGTEREKKPGGSTLVAPQPQHAQEIGKSTLAQGISPFVKNENQPEQGSTRLLTDNQRTLQTIEYLANVNAAQTNFFAAWAQAVAESLVKKDEPPSIWVTMAFEVLANMATGGLSSAAKFFTKAKPQDILSVLRGEDAPSPGPIVAALRSLGEGNTTMLIKSATSAAKRTALASLKSESKSGQQNEAFLISLGNLAAIGFEHQRTDPLNAGVSDAELILLTNSFTTNNGHTPAGYKAMIDQLLKTYDNSDAKDIGRHARHDKSFEYGRDTKVVWVNHSKLGKRLHYQKLDYGQRSAGMANIPKDVDMRDETKINQDWLMTPDFQVGEMVEVGLEQIAVEKHTAEWGRPPETMDVDDKRMPVPGRSKDVKDLNQYVPNNNPDFQSAGAGMNANDPRTWVPEGKT